MPAIGDTVWLRNPNARQGEPRWLEEMIVGETRVSWLIGPSWMKDQTYRAAKHAKKGFPRHGIALNEEDKNKYDFIAARYLMGQRVAKVTDYDKLKAIQAIVEEFEVEESKR